MIRKLVGYLLLVLFLALGGCVVYDYPHGYYDYGYPHYRSPGYDHWGPSPHPRYHRHHDWDGLNQYDNTMRSAFVSDHQDVPFMCVDPGYVAASGGDRPSDG